MGVIVAMRGLLEPIELEEDWNETAQGIEMAASKGREFVATTDSEGNNILLKMDNILTITEKDSAITGF